MTRYLDPYTLGVVLTEAQEAYHACDAERLEAAALELLAEGRRCAPAERSQDGPQHAREVSTT